MKYSLALLWKSIETIQPSMAVARKAGLKVGITTALNSAAIQAFLDNVDETKASRENVQSRAVMREALRELNLGDSLTFGTVNDWDSISMLDHLIFCLRKVESDSSIKARPKLTYGTMEQICQVESVVNMAEAVLITKQGRLDQHNVKLLKEAGFSLVAGPGMDRNTGLPGSIQTKKGSITFGINND